MAPGQCLSTTHPSSSRPVHEVPSPHAAQTHGCTRSAPTYPYPTPSRPVHEVQQVVPLALPLAVRHLEAAHDARQVLVVALGAERGGGGLGGAW